MVTLARKNPCHRHLLTRDQEIFQFFGIIFYLAHTTNERKNRLPRMHQFHNNKAFNLIPFTISVPKFRFGGFLELLLLLFC